VCCARYRSHQYLEHFGFDLARHPKNYTMALGTGAVTPLQLAGAYAVFANGGYRVKPWLIKRIVDGDGNVIVDNAPPAARQEDQRVITARNAFVMDTILRDVTRYGTAAAATRQLGRQDLAGKTGTTSDAIDGWFAGYGANVVGVAWMGYDEPRSLGGREFGATLAMPIWVDYMRVALARKAPIERAPPEDVVNDGVDWIYPEFIDAVAERTIDIEAPAEPEAPLHPDPDALPAPPGGRY
jgi:penicillin-binding protein 1A